MNRKSLFFAAAMLSALILPGAALAAPRSDQSPTIIAAAPAKPQPAVPVRLSAVQYAGAHKSVVKFLTVFKNALSDKDITASLTSLATEVQHLTDCQKAYSESSKEGLSIWADLSADMYVRTAQKIFDLVAPLDAQIIPAQKSISAGIAQLGTSASKMLAEKDVASLLSEIQVILQPMADANLAIGHISAEAAAAAQSRFPAVEQKLFDEELHNQLLNYLQNRWVP